MQGSLEKIQLALEAEPEAAQMPFFEPSFDQPLCFAAREGHLSLSSLDLLLQHGASPNATDTYGWTPLMLLCTEFKREIEHKKEDYLVLDGMLGFSTKAAPGEGRRKLQARKLELMRVLVLAGADPFRPNPHGDSPVDLVRAAGHDSAADALSRCARAPARLAFATPSSCTGTSNAKPRSLAQGMGSLPQPIKQRIVDLLG